MSVDIYDLPPPDAGSLTGATPPDQSLLLSDSTQNGGMVWRPPPLGIAYNYAMGSASYRIGFGGSTDGRRFSRAMEPAISAGSGFESAHVKNAALAVVAGLIYCYYSGYNGADYATGLAISYDGGATFTKYSGNPILSASLSWEASSVQFPVVLYDLFETDSSKRWKMWYGAGISSIQGQGGIGYAYSSDGLSWTKYAGNPVLTPGGGAWESAAQLPGAVVRLGNTYYLFYNGSSGTGGSEQWGAGLATFTDPTGTYTKSAGNPLLSGDAIDSALSVAVSLGDTTLHVADSTVFPIGCPVWVVDNANYYLSYVSARPSSTTILLADAAPHSITTTSAHVRSAAYHSVFIKSAAYDGGWSFATAVFQPQITPGGNKELTMLAYADTLLGAVRLDYSAGLALRPSLAETQGSNTSLENASIAALMDTPRRYLAGLAYQRVQVGGTSQTARSALDLEPGYALTFTATDDGANDRTQVTMRADSGWIPVVLENSGGTAPIFVVTDDGLPVYVETTG